MSTTGRKRKQLLKPRQDLHKSPAKQQNNDVKMEPMLSSSYPLADYDCVDIKPDLTELQLQLVAPEAKKDAIEATTTVATAATVATAEEAKSELELQQSDSDEDGYSEINFGAEDVYCQEEVDDYDPDWTVQQLMPRHIFKFNTTPQQTGLNAPRKSLCPVFCFYQLLGNRNEFFAQLARSCNGRSSSVAASAEELEIFVGLCLLLSDVKLANLSDYWNEHMFFGFVGFAKKMSLQRFLELMQSLNFDEFKGSTNAAAAAGDAGQLINYLNARMSELYVCGQQLVLNEPIVQWKHKFSYQDELPTKHRCNALMLHLLTEPSGLIIRILPEIVSEKLARNSRQLVAHRNELALQLLQEQQQRGHSVYVCKYYGSYGLAHELAKLGLYCSGLLDRNRYGNSKALVHQQLASNTIANRYAAPLMMAKWRRRSKCVYFYSSDCLAIYAKELSMQKGTSRARPKLIQELDFQLRPTQSSRHQLLSYQPNCSGLAQQQQLSIYLLNMLVFNAHLIYSANAQRSRTFPGSEPIKLKTYAEVRVAIIKSLLKLDNAESVGATLAEVTPAVAAPTAARVKINSQDQQSKRTKLSRTAAEPKHELVVIQQNGTATRKNCRYCGKVGMLQYTKYMCNLCPNTPGLCQDPCFQLWHDQLSQQNMTIN